MRNADEKKPKIGPREQQLRDMREARVAKNKAIIDRNVREITTVLSPKVKKGKGKPKPGRKVKTVVLTKKRGRSR